MGGNPDFFYREAQRLGYVARSAFKLIQMQKQYKIISPGGSVLDLGCAPGAWLQVACQNLGPLEKGGAVVGIDTTKVKVPPQHCDSRVKTVCGDVMKLPREQVRALSPKQKGFSVILSDMCPLVSGITSRDAALSVELGMRALDLSVGTAAAVNNAPQEADSDSSGAALDTGRLLKPGGHLIIKLLESEDIKEFNQTCKPLFRKASWLRPKATRSCSREIYLICQGLL
ncbi:ribosomal RNA large subunit methyltransferase E-like [Salvia divinorum]|uniref:rRNA methyltransferase 2, mitochondrial n=1 Tax=Salvia divinorum TaxID=28513 RepID=A0ABD1GDJ4_SALDI